MNIESFLPEYPAVSSEGFYQDIYDRQEFRELKLVPEEPIPTEPGVYMNHQKIPARFISPFTMYDRILLMWEMGAGKTCAAVNIAEGVFNEPQFGIDRAIYLARSTELGYKFKVALSEQCTGGKYIPEAKKRYNERSYMYGRNKLINRKYTINTFEMFATGEIGNLSEAALKKKFSNRVFIIDEIHNLRDTETVKSKTKRKTSITSGEIYNRLLKLFSAVENVKVVFLSGTPMTNTADEIGAIFQLLTGDVTIPTRNEFIEKFMETNDDGVLEVRDEKLPELQSIFRGRVSYLRATSIPTVFEGERLGNMNHFILYPDTPDRFQLEGYTHAYRKDTATGEGSGRSGIFNSSREASMLVFPDGSWGMAGYNKYISPGTQPILPENPTIADVRRLSAKYAMILEQLLLMREGRIPKRKIFVFGKYLRGSGLLAFASILERFGWSPAREAGTVTSDRYAIVTASSEITTNVNKILAKFNAPDNVTGDKIQILLGTSKIAEGYDLYDTNICHILTPHWNYSQTEQAIARIKRMGRHAGLEQLTGERVTVYVYLHCLVTPPGAVESIDLKMYKTSEVKDVAIAKMRRILKRTAMDCQLTYARNYRETDIDGSRECDYTVCEYTCEGITNPASENINHNTWQLYYADTVAIKNLLSILLRNQFQTTIMEAIDFIQNGTETVSSAHVTVHALLRVISEMIDSIEPIEDMYGFNGYIAVEGDRIFLTPNPFGDAHATDSNYLQKIAVEIPVDLERYISPNIFLQLLQGQLTQGKREELLGYLSPAEKEKILEDIVLSKQLSPELSLPGREALYEIFREFITTDENGIVSRLMYNPSTGRGTRCLFNGSTVWENCNVESLPVEEETKLETLSEQDVIERAVTHNDNEKIYGKIVSDKFKVVRAKQQRNGKWTATKGKVCSSYSLNELRDIAAILGIDNRGNKERLCNSVQAELLRRKLVTS